MKQPDRKKFDLIRFAEKFQYNFVHSIQIVLNISILTYQAMELQETVATTDQPHRIHKNQERMITELDSGMHRSI